MMKLQTYHVGNEIRFERFFVSFPTLKYGFVNRCKRFIRLDGCHLKGPHGGEGCLLSAVTLDANNRVFSITVCICESENLESWRWFLELLGDYLWIQNEKVAMFMTNRQNGAI